MTKFLKTFLSTKMSNFNSNRFSKIVRFARWLKITEKVSFNIKSDASYVYVLSGEKLIKNARSSQFWRVFENIEQSNNVTKQVNFIR